MTDEELIARLRAGAEADIWADTDTLDADDPFIAKIDQTQRAMTDAADRMEALVAHADAMAVIAEAYRDRAERLEAAASAVADDVCDYICPSIGLAGRPIPHDPRCIALRAALTQKDRTDG